MDHTNVFSLSSMDYVRTGHYGLRSYHHVGRSVFGSGYAAQSRRQRIPIYGRSKFSRGDVQRGHSFGLSNGIGARLIVQYALLAVMEYAESGVVSSSLDNAPVPIAGVTFSTAAGASMTIDGQYASYIAMDWKDSMGGAGIYRIVHRSESDEVTFDADDTNSSSLTTI